MLSSSLNYCTLIFFIPVYVQGMSPSPSYELSNKFLMNRWGKDSVEIKLIPFFMHQVFPEHLFYAGDYVISGSVAKNKQCFFFALMKYWPQGRAWDATVREA